MKKKNHNINPNKVRRLRGQTLTEYLILTAIIAIGSITIVSKLGSNIHSRLANISDRLINKGRNIEGRVSKKEDFRMRDMDDFHMAEGKKEK